MLRVCNGTYIISWLLSRHGWLFNELIMYRFAIQVLYSMHFFSGQILTSLSQLLSHGGYGWQHLSVSLACWVFSSNCHCILGHFLTNNPTFFFNLKNNVRWLPYYFEKMVPVHAEVQMIKCGQYLHYLILLGNWMDGNVSSLWSHRERHYVILRSLYCVHHRHLIF